MNIFQNTLVKELSTIARAIVIAALFIGGAALAADFTQPTQNPPQGNVAAPLNTGSATQVKAGNLAVGALSGVNLLGANKVISQDKFCFRDGATDDCITAWPSGGDGGTPFSTTCTVNSRLIHGTDNTTQQWGVPHSKVGYVPSAELANQCMGRLTEAERNAGWMVSSFDNCPGVQGKDCAGVSYCQYIQLECGEGITFQQGSFDRRSWTAGGSGNTTNPGTEIPGPGSNTTNPALNEL